MLGAEGTEHGSVERVQLIACPEQVPPVRTATATASEGPLVDEAPGVVPEAGASAARRVGLALTAVTEMGPVEVVKAPRVEGVVR